MTPEGVYGHLDHVLAVVVRWERKGWGTLLAKSQALEMAKACCRSLGRSGGLTVQRFSRVGPTELAAAASSFQLHDGVAPLVMGMLLPEGGAGSISYRPWTKVGGSTPEWQHSFFPSAAVMSQPADLSSYVPLGAHNTVVLNRKSFKLLTDALGWKTIQRRAACRQQTSSTGRSVWGRSYQSGWPRLYSTTGSRYLQS